MLLRGSIAAVALALPVLSGAPSARADEAYVCDAGRVVYVKPGELEAMKRSDPCIAGYYGITLAPPAPVAPAKAPAVELKTLPAPEDQADNSKPSPTKVASVSLTIVHRAAPVAAPGTDFRNVRLINAGPGSDGWYRHTR